MLQTVLAILLTFVGLAALVLLQGVPGLVLGAVALPASGILFGRAIWGEQAHLLRLSLDRSSQAIYWINEEGRVVEANGAACRMLGYDRRELRRLHIADIDPNVTPQNWAYDWTERSDPNQFATIHRRKDGTSVPVHVMTYPLRRRHGFIRAAHISDISARIDSETQLAHLNGVLTQLATSKNLDAPDLDAIIRHVTETTARALDVERVSVWFFDDTRSAILCEDIFHRSPGRHESGMQLLASSHPVYFRALETDRVIIANDAPRHPATVEFREEYLDPHRITSMLDCPIRVGGVLVGIICHEHVGSPRQWSDAEVTFATGIADLIALSIESVERRLAGLRAREAERQLAETARLQRQLVEAELEETRAQLVRQTRLATIGQIAASIAHELRNPLGAVRNAAYLMRRRGLADEKIATYISIVEHESRVAEQTITNLLEMSRNVEPHVQNVEIEPIARDAWKRAGPSADIELVVRCEGVRLRADPDQMRQVFTNIMENACNAIEGVGSVVVRASETDLETRIEIEDSGEGVPPHLREQIFDALFTTRAKGTGLGLAICRQIIEQHHGTIEVTEGTRGALFLITIPKQRGGPRT